MKILYTIEIDTDKENPNIGHAVMTVKDLASEPGFKGYDIDENLTFSYTNSIYFKNNCRHAEKILRNVFKFINTRTDAIKN